MIAAERQQIIEAALVDAGAVNIHDMARRLGVSDATVRRDFERVAETGRARRVHGGLQRVVDLEVRPPYQERTLLNRQEKDRIGRAAAALVDDGDVIIMDGGTTTSSLAPYLVGREVQVITNSLTVADYLCDHSMIEVLVTGGWLYRPSKVLLGSQALQALRRVNAGWTFVSTSGLTPRGVGHSNGLVVELEKLMIQRGRRVALLADHTKFSTPGTVQVCPWTTIDDVVTDRPVPQQFARLFARLGIDVTVAR
jgi:DeoR/GlpR family transcriptional regulator of sugar metabolism